MTVQTNIQRWLAAALVGLTLVGLCSAQQKTRGVPRERASVAQGLRAQRSADHRAMRHSAVEAVLLKRQAATQARAAGRRQLATRRQTRISRDKAYRIVSRKKSRPIPRSKSTYASDRRGGITRGKKRGSEYLESQSRSNGNSRNRGRGYY